MVLAHILPSGRRRDMEYLLQSIVETMHSQTVLLQGLHIVHAHRLACFAARPSIHLKDKAHL